MQHARLHLEQTESTNDVGGQWLKTAKSGEILAVWTTNQTQGRGQRGNAWEQSPGLDLALTVVVKWPADAPHQDPVATNKAVTVSIRNAIADLLTESSGIRAVGIKWPNDILVQNSAKRWLKCAGILIENTWRGTTWDGMLVGVGVNVNSAHNGAGRRCALGEFASSPLTMEQVEACLSEHILAALNAHGSPTDYQRHLVGCGQPKRFSLQGQSGMGTVTGVNPTGALEMEWTPEGGPSEEVTIERSDTLDWVWLWE